MMIGQVQRVEIKRKIHIRMSEWKHEVIESRMEGRGVKIMVRVECMIVERIHVFLDLLFELKKLL